LPVVVVAGTVTAANVSAALLTVKEDDAMPGQCRCGRELGNVFHSLGCLECGASCCPSCAISLESATYCPACAGALLESATVRPGRPFDLH
jgi:hypothetical protein